MDVKAVIAQGLIAHSWQQRYASSPPPKPWWWADTRAIAELKVSRLGTQVFVMQDDSGESLAFGPGHLTASASISSPGHVMIAGHRDSHFDFLQHLEVGDAIETTDFKSSTARYEVIDISVLNTDTEELVRNDANWLTLITCYPFTDFIPGGPLRYIVNAERIDL
jgi:sortase A